MTIQKSDDLYTCPVCNNQFHIHVDDKEIMYCPFCGADRSWNVVADTVATESKEEINTETKEVIKEEIIDETKNEVNTETKEENIEAEKEMKEESKEKDAELKEEKEIAETFESNKIDNSNSDSFEIKEEKYVPTVLRDDSEKEIYTCPVCKNQFFIHAIDGIRNCPFCGTEIVLHDVSGEATEPKNDIGIIPVEIKDDKATQAFPEINSENPVNENLYAGQQTQEPSTEAIGTQIVFHEVTEPEIEKSAVTEKAEISEEKTEPTDETAKQDDTKPIPVKEKRPYDVIFGTILFIIGMILILVYTVFTSNGIIDRDAELPKAQAEQTVESTVSDIR